MAASTVSKFIQKSSFNFLRIPLLSTCVTNENDYFRYYNSSVPLNAKFYKDKPVSVLVKSSRPRRHQKPFENRDPGTNKQKMVIADVDVELDLQKMQKEYPEGLDSCEDIHFTNYHEIVENAEDYYDLHLKDEQAERNFIRQKIIERKCMKPPVEPSLITWETKAQIRYLHKLDPVEWNPETFTKHFPISLPGVKKLLRGKPFNTDNKKIEEYNLAVSKMWKAIAKGDIEELHEELQGKWLEGKLSVAQSLPNPAFPMSSPENTAPIVLLLGDPNKLPGEFFSLVKPYVDLKRSSIETKEQQGSQLQSYDRKSRDLELATVEEKHIERGKNWDSERPGPTEIDRSEEGILDDRRHMRHNNHVTHEHFTENMKKKLKRNRSETSEMMLDWMNNRKLGQRLEEHKTQRHEIYEADIPDTSTKYKSVEVSFDKPKSSRFPDEKEAYIYESQTGYQHPLGKNISSQDKIQIDKSMVKERRKYKVGNSFYSEEGEFLFKTF